MIRATRIGFTFCLLAGIFAAARPHPVQGEIVLSSGTWTVSGQPSENEKPEAAALFNQAYSAEQAGKADGAIGDYRDLVKKYPLSEFAGPAQFRAAKLLESQGKPDAAFDAYKKLLEDYPKSEDFDASVAAQYKIANLYLEGKRQKLLGIPTLPSMERAREMFESIVANAPFSPLAPTAQFGIGQAYEKDDDVDNAVAAYAKVVEKYPESEVADDAQYQIGYLWLKRGRAAYDQAAAGKARDAFEEYLMRFPESEKAAQAKDNLRQLETKQTGDAMQVAQFYDKQKNYKAAAIYYNEVIAQQPDSEQAQAAKERVDELQGLVGNEALVVGPEKAETGAKTRRREKLQAQVDIGSRADYVGPPAPVIPDELPEAEPELRTSPMDVAPLPELEPDLPQE